MVKDSVHGNVENLSKHIQNTSKGHPFHENSEIIYV
jgi:hypothetical protein